MLISLENPAARPHAARPGGWKTAKALEARARALSEMLTNPGGAGHAGRPKGECYLAVLSCFITCSVRSTFGLTQTAS